MRAVREAIRPEDCMLVRLDWDWLKVVDLLHKNAIKENFGGPNARLPASDPAYRGSGEGKRGARASCSACGRSAFAPAPVHITVSPVAAVGNRWIFFLKAPSRCRYVECVHHNLGTGRGVVFSACRLDRQRVGSVGQSRCREYHFLNFKIRRISVDFAGSAAIHLHTSDAGVRAAVAAPVDRRSAKRQGNFRARCVGNPRAPYRWVGKRGDPAATPCKITIGLKPTVTEIYVRVGFLQMRDHRGLYFEGIQYH